MRVNFALVTPEGTAHVDEPVVVNTVLEALPTVAAVQERFPLPSFSKRVEAPPCEEGQVYLTVFIWVVEEATFNTPVVVVPAT